MITYGSWSHIHHEMSVYLDGKKVGTICQTVDGMFQYWPKGSLAEGSEKFPTIGLCKASLEGRLEPEPKPEPTWLARSVEDWCEANLFGPREVDGVKIDLSPTQQAVKKIAVEIITKWEARDASTD